MLKIIKRYLARFPYAINGMVYAFLNDFSYRFQVYGGALVVLITLLIIRPFTGLEFLFILLAWVLILITELQNSAIEAALDKLHPELHESIKHSKDMAAGAVLTAGLFLLITVLVLIYGKL
jgi:undecaprenol kinase